jgi:hypothetical protein
MPAHSAMIGCRCPIVIVMSVSVGLQDKMDDRDKFQTILAVGYSGMCLDSVRGAQSVRSPVFGLNRGDIMPNLNAPSRVIFLVSLALAILALLGALVIIPVITQYAFWLAILAYVVLALGTIMKGM